MSALPNLSQLVEQTIVAVIEANVAFAAYERLVDLGPALVRVRPAGD